MSPKDLFRIILKIIALLVIVSSIIPLVFNGYGWFGNDLFAIFILIGLVFLYVALIFFIITKTDLIIKWLKLDSGYDSNFFNFEKIDTRKTIYLSSIVIGLYLCLSTLPTILQESYILFKSKVSNNFLDSTNFQNDYYLYNSIIQFFVGVIIVASRKQISNLFTSKTK